MNTVTASNSRLKQLNIRVTDSIHMILAVVLMNTV